MQFADPKSDIAFKKLFGDEHKKHILICFLNAVLDLQGAQTIVDLTILNPYQAPKISALKETNLDIRATTARGVTFIVEMQVEKQDYFAKRALYYAAKAYVAQIPKGVEYPKLNQVIFIGILDFELFATANAISKHLILDAHSYEHAIKDLELNFIELPKFHKQEHELATIIDKWIYFFKHAEDLTMVPEVLSSPHELVDAFEVLAQHTWSQEELDVYEYWQMKDVGHRDALDTAKRDGFAEGRAEGHAKGRAEAEVEEKLRIARNLKTLGLSVEVILQATGLTRDDLERLTE